MMFSCLAFWSICLYKLWVTIQFILSCKYQIPLGPFIVKGATSAKVRILTKDYILHMSCMD
jgi:hypothetical protein